MSPKKPLSLVCLCLGLFVAVCIGAAVAHAVGPDRYLSRSADWFHGDEAKRIADNILTWQTDIGGFPKNVNTAAKAYTDDRAKLEGTFDNSATLDELRFLARAFNATQDERYHGAFVRGVDYILKAQYPNGGWPQFYPPRAKPSYQRYITFNDNAMVRVMQFAREISRDETYSFLDADRRAAARAAFDRGIDCILKCQIKVNGKLTAWCAQHDEVDFQPRPARSYELVSLSGSESVGIVELLMSLDQPSPEIVQAVDGAVAWFESAKLTGIRVERRPDPKSPKGRDKVVLQDAAAPPLWARFYDIATNKPIFCDRDGVPKATLAEIGYERRNGYNWLDNWAQSLLEKDYPAWKKRIAASN